MGIDEKGSRSKALLLKDYGRIQKESSNYSFSVGLIDDNIYTWSVVIIGPKDTAYENGIYTAEMIFTQEYPDMPPTFRFTTPIWHPNIDNDGNVCISILHNPGTDEFGYEAPEERWLPVRTPESIILSILCLLSSPNCDSSANLEASIQYQNDPQGYKMKVVEMAQKSLH